MISFDYAKHRIGIIVQFLGLGILWRIALLFFTVFWYFLFEFPTRQDFNIWVVTVNSTVCSLQGIGARHSTSNSITQWRPDPRTYDISEIDLFSDVALKGQLLCMLIDTEKEWVWFPSHRRITISIQSNSFIDIKGLKSHIQDMNSKICEPLLTRKTL